MSSGDPMIDERGNPIIDEDGNPLIDDGEGNYCCCGESSSSDSSSEDSSSDSSEDSSDVDSSEDDVCPDCPGIDFIRFIVPDILDTGCQVSAPNSYRWSAQANTFDVGIEPGCVFHQDFNSAFTRTRYSDTTCTTVAAVRGWSWGFELNADGSFNVHIYDDIDQETSTVFVGVLECSGGEQTFMSENYPGMMLTVIPM